MSLPRPNRTKFGMSLREIAHWTGESLSALKRQSIKDPEALRAKVDALEGASSSEPEEPELDPAILALGKVGFEIATLKYNLRNLHPDISEKLDAILDIVWPWVESED